MNNVKAKPLFIFALVVTVIIFVMWIVSILAYPSIMNGSILTFPFLLIYSWILLLNIANFADLYLDETNGILTVMKLFKERTVPLKDLEIKRYTVGSHGIMRIYTNMGNIRVYFVIKNWRIFCKLFEARNPKLIEPFLKDVKQRNGGYSFDPNTPEEMDKFREGIY